MSAIYRKGQVLGWGSVSTAFKGWDELLDRPVAVKELIPPFATNDTFIRAYFAQALRLVDLSNRHVLAMYGVDPNRNPPSLTRELADETLAHQLIDGTIASEEVVRLLRQVLAGLSVMHDREILHHSIKPENIFMSGGVYKIGDFGVGPLEGTTPPVPARQRKFFAPELLAGEEEVGASSDLYSLGLVLHELLLGSVRFERLIEETVLGPEIRVAGQDVEEDTPDLWPAFHLAPMSLPPLHEVDTSIPVALSLILQRMIRKSPAERYESCRAVLSALGAAGLVETLAGTQPLIMTAPTRAVVSRDRTSWWMSGGVAAALALAGTALLIGVRDRQAPARAEILTSTSGTSEPGTAQPPAATPALADQLLGLRSSEDGLRMDLATAQGEGTPQLFLNSPLRFRAYSDRAAHLALFVLSSDGSVTSIYPGPKRSDLRITADQSLDLPLAEDGDELTLYASEPLGKDIVFLLASDNPLPPLPTGDIVYPVVVYPAKAEGSRSSASSFIQWVTRLRQADASGTRLVAQEFEIVKEE